MEEIELVSRRKSASNSSNASGSGGKTRRSNTSRRSNANANASFYEEEEEDDDTDDQPEPVVGRSLNSSNGDARNRFSSALRSKVGGSPRKSIRTYKVRVCLN